MTSNDQSWLRPVLEYAGDGVGPLRRLGREVEPTRARLAALADLAAGGEAHTEVASLWVIKHWLENGAVADAALAARLLVLLEREDPGLAPDGALHLLQLLPYLPEPLPEPARLFQAAQRLARAGKTFVRAWAYNTLALVAHQHPAFHEEAEFWMQRAEATESASVRARIRNARVGRFRP